MNGHFEGRSMIWDEGEIPECGHCGATATETQLWETNFSGGVTCGAEDCSMQTGMDNFCDMIEWVKE